MAMETLSIRACCICEATKRCQMILYRVCCSEDKNGFTLSGVKLTETGRMASWASWAFFLFL